MKFSVQLVKFGDVSDTDTITIDAEDAVQASHYAEMFNPGYLAVQAEPYEED